MDKAIQPVLEELLKLQPLLLNRSFGFMQHEGFSPLQLAVLATLAARGEMTLSACCRCMQISKQQLSKLIDVLESRRQVDRRINPDNRRSVLIAISDQGMEALRQRRQQQIDQLMPLFSQLKEQDLEALKNCCQTLSGILNRLQSKEKEEHDE